MMSPFFFTIFQLLNIFAKVRVSYYSIQSFSFFLFFKLTKKRLILGGLHSIQGPYK